MDEHGTLEVKLSGGHVGVSTGKTKIYTYYRFLAFLYVYMQMYTHVF